MIEAHPALDDTTRAAVRALAEEVATHDGVAAFDEETRLDLRDGHATRHHVVARVGARVVGYAWTDGTSGELAVAPESRRRGLGGALLDTVLALAPRTALWAHGHLPPARRLAASRGLVVTRELLTMRWNAPAGPPEPGTLPPGYHARTFTPADLAAFTAANAEVFASHPEQGTLTVDDMGRRMAEPWFDPKLLTLLEHDGHIAAFAWVKPDTPLDEIYLVGVREPHRGRGIASWLVANAQRGSISRGREGMLLYVEGDNLTAVGSYSRAGFRRDSSDVQYSVDETLA